MVKPAGEKEGRGSSKRGGDNIYTSIKMTMRDESDGDGGFAREGSRPSVLKAGPKKNNKKTPQNLLTLPEVN